MLNAFISLSAVDRDSADNYMKIVMSLVMTRYFEYDATYRRKTNMWFARVDPFVRRFKLKQATLANAHKMLAAGKDPDTDPKFAALIDKVVEDLKAKTPSMKTELDLRREDLGLLNDLRLIHTKESEAAFKRLSKAASRFQDPDINSMFVSETDDTSSEQSALEALVKKYTGKSGYVLPIDLLKQWQDIAKKKGDKLKDHASYLELRRKLNTAQKSRILTLVRSSGQPTMPVRDIISALDDEGIPHTLPKGFVGLMDDQGKFYTTEGQQLIQTPVGDVRMNPSYNAKEDNAYVCEFYTPGAAQPTRAYTANFRGRSKQKKFSVVSDTVPLLNALSKKWRSQMTPLNKKEAVLATLLEFIFDTSARAGNPKAESKGQRTFGATQLLVKHFKIDESKIVVSYQGKSGGKQRHVINYAKTAKLKPLAKNIKALVKGKSPSDPVFTFKDSTFTSTSLSRYMQTIGFPKGFSVHKLRTARGTQMAVSILKKSPFKKGGDWSEREVNKWVEGELLKIGIELGHMSGEKFTTNTAIQNYIAPEVLGDFYSKLGIRPPAKIQKALDALGKDS